VSGKVTVVVITHNRRPELIRTLGRASRARRYVG
jgi:hypothetical protein